MSVSLKMREDCTVVSVLLLALCFSVTADEAITRSYNEMKEKAAYDVISCGVCKGFPHIQCIITMKFHHLCFLAAQRWRTR